METAEVKGILGDKVQTAYAVLFGVFALFVFIFIVKMDLGAYSKLKNFRTTAQQTLSVLKLLSDYKTYIGEFDTRFIANKDANWIIGVLNETAKKNNIVLDLVKPIGDEVKEGYKIISVLVEGKASYHQIGEFIARLESSDKFFIIQECSVSAQDESGYESADFGQGGMGMPFAMGGMPGDMGAGSFPGQAGMGMGTAMGMGQSKAPFKEERVTAFKMVIGSLSIEKK